jgi:hypothetical protein
LSILNENNYLSIEKRDLPSTGEVTPLYFGSQSLGAYSLEFQFYSEENFNVFLVDNYTDQTLSIPQNAEFAYHFNVDASIPESISNTRFEIVYDNPALSTEEIIATNYMIYPNPLTYGESLYIQSQHNLISDLKSVELLNLNGQVMEIFQPSIQDSGHNEFKIDFKFKPANGTYLLRIMTDHETINHKIIIK